MTADGLSLPSPLSLSPSRSLSHTHTPSFSLSLSLSLASPPLSLSLVHTHTHPHARSRRHGHTQRASLVLCITAPALSFVPFFRGFRSLSLSLSLSLPACLSLSLCLSVCEESLLVVCVSLPRIVRDDPRPRLQLHLSLATHMFCSVPKLVVAVTPRPP